MLKQTVLGEKYIPGRYQREIKHVIFECNTCHEQFLKKESYFRKQLKTKKNTCCFCSPACRSKYFFYDRKDDVQLLSVKTESTTNPPQKKNAFLKKVLKSLLR